MAYSDTQRQEALDLYPEHGTSETSRRTGIPQRTIRRWANEEGLTAARSKALEEGGEMLSKTVAVMRSESQVKLAERILDLLDRMEESHIEYKAAGSEMHRLEYEIATSTDVRNYASAVKDLLTLLRLELGEHTSRTYHDGTDDIDRSYRQLVGELERRR